MNYLDETVADEEAGEILWITRPLGFGTWTLIVDPGDGEAITRQVEVAPGRPAEIVLP